MEREALWRQERLSLGDLARHLAVPEYRLRRAINAHLGHRSFSAFICGYRLQAAARMLEDPARGAAPILAIALDCGFASVGPFNRAFRARFGMAPGEYRATRLQGHAAPAPIRRIGETPRAR
jgi:AraC-like DNA-binding protein